MDSPVRAADAIAFVLNGEPVLTEALAGERLSASLRERLSCRDVKVGCNAGDCGACTVLLDGAPVCACLVAAHQAQGRRIDTARGLIVHDPHASRLASRFRAHGAAQCGICTPGMIVSATALLRQNRAPDAAAIEDALGGVLCRCTGYRRIIEAVLDAAGQPAEPIPESRGHGVGASIARLDADGRIDGTERFGDDIAPPGTLRVLVIRSPHAHAAFTLGDLARFIEDHPGIQCCLTAGDIAGLNRFGVIPAFVDQPVFAETVARFRGEAVAAIVGTPDAIAAFDPATFPVTWRVLPALESMADALGADGPAIHPERPGNVMCRGHVACGDADAALRAAAVTVSGRFETSFVEHAYIEPEAGYAEVRDGRVVIHACTQAPVMDQESLAVILGVEPSRVRVVPSAVGGGFGAKLDLSVQPYLALAALKTGRPVRLAYSRTESMQSTTKRHPATMTLTIGAARDGKISGFRFEGDFNTGAYASWGPTVATRVPVHASGPYAIADYRADSRAVHTHAPPAGAFRGFGVPQAAIAQEVLFDELADRLGLDPLEFRLLNALANGVRTVCGQVFESGVGIPHCLEALRPAWQKALDDHQLFNDAQRAVGGPLRRGAGVAAGWYGCGNTSLANPSTIKAGIRADGSLVLHQGAVDIGQGSNTVITQIFAQALGVPTAAVGLVGGDTDLTPDAGKTSASRQTFVTGNAAKLAGEALRLDILKRCNVAPEDDARIRIRPGVIEVESQGRVHAISLETLEADDEGYVLRACETYDPPTRPLDADGQGEPYAQFGYAAHLAAVEVDQALGTVRALSFVAAHDVGRAINPLLVEGQVHGGIAQGLGMALMEAYHVGRSENLHDYLIPTIGDVPPIETIIIEEADPHGPFGAKGLGEHALIPTAPAILNAINRACGLRLRAVPVTPSRLRAALAGRGL